MPPLDRSRDRRIEDPTNLFLIHPAAAALLPWCVRHGVSANVVSIVGFTLGVAAACAYAHWRSPLFVLVGFTLSVFWLMADGLDGMIARATNSASAAGRVLDGLCDHGVFIAIYVALALSIDTVEGWFLACTAGVSHALQSNLYEGERARFHRRCRGNAGVISRAPSALARLYDSIGASIERSAGRFDVALAQTAHPVKYGQAYGRLAAAPMRLMSLQSANVRLIAIVVACLFADPRLFWWFEIIVLSPLLLAALLWHRWVERQGF